MARLATCLTVLLAVCTAAGPAWSSFPGRNGTIAYLWIGDSAYRAGPTETSIRTVDPRTGAVRVLRDCPLRTTDYGASYTDCVVLPPSWAPGGASLAFPITRITPDFTGQPWRVDPAIAVRAENGRSYQEHSTADRYNAVSWSPGGGRLLLERMLTESGPSAGSGILLASLDRTELRQIGPALSGAADWSSRGEIAFSHSRDASCLPACDDIFVTRLDREPRRLTYRGGSTPSWSPRGTKLVFARHTRRQTNVYVVGRNGDGLRQLTRGGGYNPVWSPDGRWIAFIRAGDLYVIRPDGEDRRRLVNSMLLPDLFEGPQVQALDWQPLPRR